MFQNRLCLSCSHDRRQGGDIRLFHGLQAAEMFQQTAGCGWSDAGDFP